MKDPPEAVCFVIHGMGGYSQMRYDQLMQSYESVCREDLAYSVEFIRRLLELISSYRMAPGITWFGHCGQASVAL